MGRRKQRKTELDRRRAKVADLYVQGWTQTDIGNHLSISQPTVSTDIKAIQKQWRESAIQDFDLLRERELRRIDRVEREAWAAWERSQSPAQQEVVSTDGAQQKTQTTVKGQCGDPRYLEVVNKCIGNRRALLGLDLPSKVSLTSPDGQEAYHTHVMSELMRMAEEENDSPEVVDAEYIGKVVEQRKLERAGAESGNGKPENHVPR